MRKKKGLLSLLITILTVLVLSLSTGIIFSLSPVTANAVDYELEGYELEEYVVAQNDDFGGATTLSWPKGDATSGLTLKNDLPTASFVYKFNFTPNAGGDTALALRSAYWGSYYFAFKGKTLRYHLNADDVTVGEVFTDGVQVVEVGVIDIKDSNLTWFFLKVNGEIKMSVTASDVLDVKGISVWGDQTAKLEQVSFYEESELENYVVAQNEDFGGATTLSWPSGVTSGLTLKNDLSTASFVYKFNFTPNGGGQTALALRSSYYGAYHFLFQGKTLKYNLNGGYITVGEVFTDGAQLVEVGAIEIKNSNLTWFYLKIDGRWIVSATASDVPDVKGISVWGPQAVFAQYSYNVTFTDVATKEVLAGQAIGNLPTAPQKAGYDFVKWTCGGEEVTAETVVSAHMTVVAEYAERGYYIDEELEEYVVAQNDDFGGAATLSWGSDATSNLKLTNTTATASFVYKFNFTPNDGSGQTALSLRSSYWGSYYFVFKAKTLWYHLNSADVKVGEVFTDGAQVVEVGAIDIKDSDLTWFFLKVDGEIKMSATASDVPDKKGISIWGPQAVFAQYSYDVSFTGVETREVLAGQAIGNLPTAPKQAGKRFVGWMDQNGNTVTSETKPTSNLTLTGKYETYYEDSELEDYVVAQNDDFGGAITLSWPDGGATGGLKLNNDLPTASFVYKFNFTPNAGGDTALAVRSSSWGAYYFVFKGKTLRYNLNAGKGNDVTVGEVFTDGAQLVEVGAIEIKNSDLTWFFLKVDGEIKMSTTVSGAPDVKGISVWGDQTAKLEQVSFYEESELEEYVVVQNDDFGGATTLSWPNEGATNGLVLNNDLPTASFVYKFNFTPNSGGQTALALRSSYYGDYHFLFQGKTLLYNLKAGYVTVGEVFTDGAQVVEVGAIEIKNSNLTWFYLKIDGRWIVSATASDVPDVKGISVWGESAIFEQYSYSVTFKGIETREVLVGETIGDLPDIGVSAIWKDANGNIITADTVPTSDLYLATDAKLQFTIKDTEGNDIVIDYTIGEEIEYDAYGELTKDSTTFIGYLVGETLYKDLSDAIIEQEKTGKEIIAKTITVGIIDGASIRLSATNASIRFTSAISIADSEKVVDFGILLTTEDVRQTLSEFTIAGLHGVDSSLYYNYNKNSGNLRYVENKDYANQYVYSLVLEKVSKANYGVKYTARAYVLVEYADGTQAYVYSEFDEENHVRSMYDVASAAIVDNAAGYTDVQKTIIQKYIDGVIDLNEYLELQGRERNYTVSVSDIDANGDYTVTVTPKNGFDITGIGAIYVEGVKVAVKEANANTGTFKISESDIYANVLPTFEQSMTERNDITEFQIAAYSGPSLGVKQISPNDMVAGGYVATYDDLKTYMEAGFDAWYVDASCLVSVTGYTAKGASYHNDTPTYDVYRALDLAAEYANETGKPCPVYINIPHLTGMVMTEAYEGTTWIKLIYDIFTNYNDGVTTAANSPVNGINQLGGFLLHDEPKLADYDAFAAVFNEIAYNCGAIAAGYDFTCALLPTYAGSEHIGSSYAEYVNKYATLMQDTRISFDNYPFYYVSKNGIFNNSSENLMEDSWYSDMQAVRANENGKGTCIQSFTAGAKESGSIIKTTKYRYIDKEAEISMQVYMALAYGFTDLDYFVYWDKMTRAMMEANGATGEVFQKTPIMWNDPSDWSKGHYQSEYYGWIKNTNAEAKSLFEILSKFTSTGVQLIDGSTSGSNDFGSATTTNTTNAITVSATYDMVVGGFTADGYNGYLAVNADFPDDSGTRTNAATFTVGTQYSKAIVYVDGVATVERVAKEGTLNLNIGCGEGVFIIPLA